MDFYLYKIKSKTDPREFEVVIDQYDDAKEYIQEHLSFLDPDLRTLKKIDFPEGYYEGTDWDTGHYVFFDGECKIYWNNLASSDYPEDLTWERDIGGLVQNAIDLGKLMAHKEKVSK